MELGQMLLDKGPARVQLLQGPGVGMATDNLTPHQARLQAAAAAAVPVTFTCSRLYVKSFIHGLFETTGCWVLFNINNEVYMICSYGFRTVFQHDWAS